LLIAYKKAEKIDKPTIVNIKFSFKEKKCLNILFY